MSDSSSAGDRPVAGTGASPVRLAWERSNVCVRHSYGVSGLWMAIVVGSIILAVFFTFDRFVFPNKEVPKTQDLAQTIDVLKQVADRPVQVTVRVEQPTAAGVQQETTDGTVPATNAGDNQAEKRQKYVMLAEVLDAEIDDGGNVRLLPGSIVEENSHIGDTAEIHFSAQSTRLKREIVRSYIPFVEDDANAWMLITLSAEGNNAPQTYRSRKKHIFAHSGQDGRPILFIPSTGINEDRPIMFMPISQDFSIQKLDVPTTQTTSVE